MLTLPSPLESARHRYMTYALRLGLWGILMVTFTSLAAWASGQPGAMVVPIIVAGVLLPSMACVLCLRATASARYSAVPVTQHLLAQAREAYEAGDADRVAHLYTLSSERTRAVKDGASAEWRLCVHECHLIARLLATCPPPPPVDRAQALARLQRIEESLRSGTHLSDFALLDAHDEAVEQLRGAR